MMKLSKLQRRLFSKSSSEQSSRGARACEVETLENRQLLAAALVSIRSLHGGSETNPGTTGTAQFYFKRVGSTSAPLTIKYRRAGGTTANPADYQPLSGTVTINKGRDKVFLDVIPVDDAFVEGTEKLVLSVDTSSDYSIDKAYRYNNVLIADNDVTPPIPTSFAAPISVAVGSTARTNKVVDKAINFTSLISQGGGTGSLIENSIRVVETNSAGTSVVNSNVTYQFDKSSTFNAATNASGTLVFLAAGSSTANGTRFFKVTFATAGTFSAPTFTDSVVVTNNVTRAQEPSIRVVTTAADFYLESDSGGFSSIVDKNGVDWISEDPTSGTGAGGEFRGLPNSASDFALHPGFPDRGSTVIVYDGPLKTTLVSTVTVATTGNGNPRDKTFKVQYDIYPTYARATFLQADENYWFLYEGTPGGTLDNHDSATFSDGTNLPDLTASSLAFGQSTIFNNDINTSNGEEWAFFRDSTANKYFFLDHEQPDNKTDEYFTLNSGSGSMTVFGIGRDQLGSGGAELSGTNSFTFGIGVGGSNSTTTGNEIRETFKPLTINLGAATAT